MHLVAVGMGKDGSIVSGVTADSSRTDNSVRRPSSFIEKEVSRSCNIINTNVVRNYEIMLIIYLKCRSMALTFNWVPIRP